MDNPPQETSNSGQNVVPSRKRRAEKSQPSNVVMKQTKTSQNDKSAKCSKETSSNKKNVKRKIDFGQEPSKVKDVQKEQDETKTLKSKVGVKTRQNTRPRSMEEGQNLKKPPKNSNTNSVLRTGSYRVQWTQEFLNKIRNSNQKARERFNKKGVTKMILYAFRTSRKVKEMVWWRMLIQIPLNYWIMKTI